MQHYQISVSLLDLLHSAYYKVSWKSFSICLVSLVELYKQNYI